MGFVEKDERALTQEIRPVAPTIIGGSQASQTIPAGSATVAGGAINIPAGQGAGFNRGNGNNDLGL
jgi:hypothetical protein